ncbi:MAG: hypothetical protein MUF34_02465 [Polyangiaceae bacterium]|nr:hypothetical protein [Polyangiaceae bacterium]
MAREREADAMRPDLWSRLAQGELAALELSALEARAATDPPLELSLRAYRPLSGEVRERIVDALSASLSSFQAAPGAPQTPATTAEAPAGRLSATTAEAAAGRLSATTAEAFAERASATTTEAFAERASATTTEAFAERTSATPPASVSKVVSLDARRRLLRTATPVAVALSAAAALLLVLRSPERPEVATFADLAPLPAYDLSVRGGLKQTRGVEEPTAQRPLRLAPSSELDLTLRPATRVEGPLALRTFVVQQGKVQPWAAPVEIAPTGALRVHGAAAKLLPGLEGVVELRLVVGRAEVLGEGSDLQAKAMAPSGSGPGWQTLRYNVELVKEP